MRIIRLPITRYDLPTLIKFSRGTLGFEVGVDRGYFSHYLLRNTNLGLWSIDTWAGKQAPCKLDTECSLREFGNRSRILHTSSEEAFKLAVKEQRRFGFGYIDGDHRYAAVKQDLKLWYTRMENGGVLAGHDYAEAHRCGVIQAVNEFAEELGADVLLTSERLATWIIFCGAER